MKYLLDTCIFNWIRDRNYTVADLPPGEYVVTHIQRDEIGNVKDQAHREDLLRLLEEVADSQISTGVLVLGVSRLGQAALGSGNIYHRVFNELDLRERKRSNLGDAIIGATAHAGGYGIVTADRNFFEVMSAILPAEHLRRWMPPNGAGAAPSPTA